MSSFLTMANVRLQADQDPLFRGELLLEEGRFGEVIELLSPLLQAGRGGLLVRTLLTRGFLGAGQREQGLALARDTASSIRERQLPLCPWARRCWRAAGHHWQSPNSSVLCAVIRTSQRLGTCLVAPGSKPVKPRER